MANNSDFFDPSISKNVSMFDSLHWDKHFNHCYSADGMFQVWPEQIGAPPRWNWNFEIWHGPNIRMSGISENPQQAMKDMEKWYKIIKEKL